MKKQKKSKNLKDIKDPNMIAEWGLMTKKEKMKFVDDLEKAFETEEVREKALYAKSFGSSKRELKPIYKITKADLKKMSDLVGVGII